MKKRALDKPARINMLDGPITRERARQMRLKMRRQWETIQELQKELDRPKYMSYSLKPLTKKHIAVLCLTCGWIRASWHRHDYRTCPCPNNAMIDGGFDYIRYGAMNMNLIQIVELNPINLEKKRRVRRQTSK